MKNSSTFYERKAQNYDQLFVNETFQFMAVWVVSSVVGLEFNESKLECWLFLLRG